MLSRGGNYVLKVHPNAKPTTPPPRCHALISRTNMFLFFLIFFETPKSDLISSTHDRYQVSR